MPVVQVFGFGPDTHGDLLKDLEAAIIAEAADALGAQPSWFTVYFQPDLRPQSECGVNIFLTTATLGEKVNGEALANDAATRVTKVVHSLLDGKRSVETFICPVPNMQWRASLHAQPASKHNA